MVRGLSGILNYLLCWRSFVDSWEVANVSLSAGRIALGRYCAHGRFDWICSLNFQADMSRTPVSQEEQCKMRSIVLDLSR